MESAAKIKEILQAASMEKLPEFIAEYENDPSGVVVKLAQRTEKDRCSGKGTSADRESEKIRERIRTIYLYLRN